ncbi:anthrone oxygenase family protein [Actinoplanes derwentensis]|uniref:Uncharacterized membrane protein n=1 Tax=Actinoplanes derwentensis TaxID=113562 RepID=A0A1H1R7G7_9ACTN|nr:anthrone oxygenase family protein [Actinoplanes derwentensis]GID88037.1 membrane protein [Actinoplanes derwentensis]SDS31734.1 Uncharacterized membrane protein [Actinoplanes derwentensis]
MSEVRDRRADAALSAATVSTGLMAGLFYAFDVAVMPGLAQADDDTFVSSMRHINRAIENPVFAATYFGSLALPATAAVLHWRAGNRKAAGWALAGTIGYGAVLAVTARHHVPLNRRLDAGGSRAAFEKRWAGGNIGRTALTTVALACLTRALHRTT